MSLLKSDERERWDPRCAGLEWFAEIRFNFRSRELELCCCRRACVCWGRLWRGGGTLKLPPAINQRQTQLLKKKEENYSCVFFLDENFI